MKKLFGALLIIVVGLALLPVVTAQVDALTGLPTGVQGLVDVIPLIYAILILVGSFAFIKFSD